MKLAVLGATGQTGIEFVKQALSQGHDVTAIVRNPAKMKIKHNHLQVVEGNIFSEESLSKHFQGADAVVSCLGFQRAKQVTGYTESAKSITEALHKTGVSRIVAMTAYFTDTTSGSQHGFFVRKLLIPFLRPILNNMRGMEKFYEDHCEDLNYTIVRPPGLGSGSASSKEIKAEIDGYFIKGITGATRMPRADVARFMLGCLDNQIYYKKAVAIGL